MSVTRRSGPNLLIGIVVFLVFATKGLALPPQWTTIRDLATTASSRADEPDVAAEGSRVRVVWTDARLGSRTLFTRVSEDDGATWSHEDLVPTLSGEAINPSVVTDGSRDTVVWTQVEDGRTDIAFSVFDGVAWSAPKKITDDGVSSRPRIALTRAFPRALGIVFERETSNGTRVVWTRSADGGTTWATPSILSLGNHVSDQPAIAAGSETFYLTWRDAREGGTEVFFNRAGIRIGSDERRLSILGRSGSPSVSVSGERVLVAWQSQVGINGPEVFVALSENGGVDWTAPTALSGSPSQSTRPTTALTDDGAWVAWQDGAFGNWEVHLARLDADGAWSANERFTSSSDASIVPRLAVAFPNGAYRRDANARTQLVWVERQSDTAALVFHSARDAIPPASPRKPAHHDISAAAGWDDDGSIAFRWEPIPDATLYRVAVFADDELSERAATEPEIVVDAPDATTVRVVVVAEDAVGNVSEPSPSSDAVHVDRSPPLVTLLEPRTGSALFERTPIRVACQDDNLRFCAVEYGETPAPSTWAPIVSPLTESFDARVIAEWEVASLQGVYTLRVRAEDFAGNVTVVTASVSVDSFPPLRVGVGGLNYPLASSDLATARREPVWSPDGGRIAFVSDEGGTQDLWIVEKSGANLRRLTRDVFLDASPTWTPDGGSIVYASLRDGVWGLYSVTVSGGSITPLLTGGESRTTPAWSPDGRRLAFAANRDGDDEIVILENVAATLSGVSPILTQVTRNNADDTRPTWSRDGRYIAFQTFARGGWDIARARLADLAVDLLVDDVRSDTSPRYSPDGKRLLFTRDDGNAPPSVVALDLVTGESTVVSPAEAPVGNGDWSPQDAVIVAEADGEIAVLTLAFPASALEARIVAPAKGAFIESTIEIRGVARGSQFADYRIEAAPVGGDDAWFAVTGVSTSPVEREGFLGGWDVRALRGAYRLRLTVAGTDGSVVEDEVRVEIRAAKPQLEVVEPSDGLETLLSTIRLRGRAEPDALVTLNGERIATDADGAFTTTVALHVGANALELEVVDALGASTTVTRRVTRIADVFAVTLEAPVSFTLIETPYVEVHGVAPRSERVEVAGVRVPVDGDGRFSRVVRLSFEETRIAVVATDAFGRTAAAQTRVFRRRDASRDRPDTLPPALTEPSPANGARISTTREPFVAVIVDDRAFDADSLMLTFDGVLLEPDDWTFDADSGTLRFVPFADLTEGVHRLVVAGNDVAGNALRFGEWRVIVDTSPLDVQLSAVPSSASDTSRVRVVVTSNRRLASVGNAQAWLPDQTVGYPLELRATRQPADDPPSQPFVYEADFVLFFGSEARFAVEARDTFGRSASVVGDFASGVLGAHQETTLRLSGDVRARFAAETTARSRRVVFRTQDGLDFARVVAQRTDIRARRLVLGIVGTGVYVLENADGGDDLPPFELSVPEDASNHRAWFAWNEAGQRWLPIVDQRVVGGRRVAPSTDARHVALLADTDAPTFVAANPEERSAISLDRYYVEVEFRDEGSGVAEAVAYADDVPVTVRLVVESSGRAFVRYAPTNLAAGFHTLRVRVTDRAGNAVEVALNYTTVALFTFTGVALVPNPVRTTGRAFFQLTENADVTLDIFTPDGTRVYNATLRGVTGGLDVGSRESFVWDLSNSTGRNVASGVYLVRFSARNASGAEIRRFAKWAVVR
jgi:hypothetical protein